MVGKTHNCKVTAFIRSVLWAIKGTAKMKRRVVDEINVDFRRLVVLAIWRAQQIRKNLQEKVTIRRTSDLLVDPTKSCVRHDRAQNEFEWWMHEVEGCFYGRDPRPAHVVDHITSYHRHVLLDAEGI